MKVDVKKIDATRRELKFEVPKERVSKKLDEVYQDISKFAKVKGFRPGKAPRHIIEANHGRLAQEEAIKKLIPEVYQEGLETEKIVPMDMPEISDVSLKDGNMSFTATFDIHPEVKLKNYKGIVVKRKSSSVTDEELNKTLEFFKKGKGDAEVTLDDNFAKGLGYPTLEEFKTSLRRQLELDKERFNRTDIENQIAEYLLKETQMVLPQSVVLRQLDHRLEEARKRLKSQGTSEEDIKKKDEDMRKDLRPVAEKDIKLYLIMEYIVKTEGLNISENDNLFAKVMEFLFKEAKWEESK